MYYLQMNGNDMKQVVETFQNALKHTGKGKPVVILMTTVMGYSVDFMMGSHKWHSIAPNDEQLKQTLAQLPETIGDY